MLLKEVIAVPAQEQLKEFNEKRRPSTVGGLLIFKGVDGYDVYNPTTPFEIDGKTVIAGRVESRENEVSRTMFFEKSGDCWILIEDAPVLNLQDPFTCEINSETVIGGIYVLWDGDNLIYYETQFFKGTSLKNLTQFAQGPRFMKDIRLLQLPDKRIAIFSRPQGQMIMEKFNAIAKIGFIVVDRIEDITPEIIDSAVLLEGHFLNSEWGGCNQLFNLSNGLIGAIGHKSWGETVDGVFVIHYYSIAFAFNPNTFEMTQVKVIAARDCFASGAQKNSRSQDVVFTSGIIRKGEGRALLYAGLSDCDAGMVEIEDPFDEYELL